MFKKSILILLTMYAALGSLGCPCTLIGCGDDVTIHVQRPVWSSDPLTVFVILDEDPITCTNIVPQEKTQDCDGSRVRVRYEPLAECSDCTGGENVRLHIFVHAAPDCINVAIQEKDVIVGKATFEPEYEVQTPNGEWCGPECHSWETAWEIP